jgi:hypothetical protein
LLHLHPIAEASESFPAGGDGGGVAVDAEEPEIGARVEKQRGMTTVASTTSPVGTGSNSSTTSRPITGTWSNWPCTSIPLSRTFRRAVAPDPSPAPRAAGASRDVSPGRGYG